MDKIGEDDNGDEETVHTSGEYYDGEVWVHFHIVARNYIFSLIWR